MAQGSNTVKVVRGQVKWEDSAAVNALARHTHWLQCVMVQDRYCFCGFTSWPPSLAPAISSHFHCPWCHQPPASAACTDRTQRQGFLNVWHKAIGVRPLPKGFMLGQVNFSTSSVSCTFPCPSSWFWLFLWLTLRYFFPSNVLPYVTCSLTLRVFLLSGILLLCCKCIIR